MAKIKKSWCQEIFWEVSRIIAFKNNALKYFVNTLSERLGSIMALLFYY